MVFELFELRSCTITRYQAPRATGIPLYGQYNYARLQSVWFSAALVLRVCFFIKAAIFHHRPSIKAFTNNVHGKWTLVSAKELIIRQVLNRECRWRRHFYGLYEKWLCPQSSNWVKLSTNKGAGAHQNLQAAHFLPEVSVPGKGNVFSES